MNGLRNIGAPVVTAMLSAGLLFGLSPEPRASISLEKVLGRSTVVDRVSTVFLSNALAAVLLHVRDSPKSASRVIMVHWANGTLEPIASTDANEGTEIYAMSGNRVIVSARQQKCAYSSDLKQKQEIPFKVLCESFPRAGVAGDCEVDGWKAFRLGSPLTLIREGGGELLSLSDEAFVYRLDNKIRTEAPDGRLLGTISVSPGSRYSHVAELAGKDRLFLTSADGVRIVDFSGREMLRVHSPEGWGFRHGWSADGGRMLFDHFTVALPWAERAFDTVFDSVFGRLGVINQEPNGETVRVIDTHTGAICFNLESREKLFGPPGDYHADLSPSGNWVVVSTVSALSIYQLPDSCAGQ